MNDADRLRNALESARAGRPAEPDLEQDEEYDALGDTAAMEETAGEEEEEAPPGRRPKSSPGVRAIRETDPAPEEAEPDEMFDRLGVDDAAELEIDPEAGSGAVAQKVREIRQAAKSPEGRLVIAVPLGLVGLALIVMAPIWQAQWLIVAAALVGPLSLWLVWRRYQQWLGHKRYSYRLLESLGEDVSDWDASRVYRVSREIKRARRRSRKRRRT